MPVFNDKHLSWNWNWAKSMVETARAMGFPFVAGSSLAVTWRLPAVDLPIGAELSMVQDFPVAVRIKGPSEPLSTQMYLASIQPGQTLPNFFNPLVHHIPSEIRTSHRGGAGRSAPQADGDRHDRLALSLPRGVALCPHGKDLFRPGLTRASGDLG